MDWYKDFSIKIRDTWRFRIFIHCHFEHVFCLSGFFLTGEKSCNHYGLEISQSFKKASSFRNDKLKKPRTTLVLVYFCLTFFTFLRLYFSLLPIFVSLFLYPLFHFCLDSFFLLPLSAVILSVYVIFSNVSTTNGSLLPFHSIVT